MDLIFRHINLVRMEKEIMNEKYLIKGVCVSVAYIIYLSLCALVTTDERLLALIHILTLVLIFVASKRYITFEKIRYKVNSDVDSIRNWHGTFFYRYCPFCK